jgi:hypothetical protein
MTLSVRTEFDSFLSQAELGLAPADLLQLVRTFVIVEGYHDKLVLEALIGDDLDAAHAVVLRVGGAKQMASLASAQLLWEFTDAQVAVVLDNLQAAGIDPIWRSAEELAAAGRMGEAEAALDKLANLPGGEPMWLRDLLTLAIHGSSMYRLHPMPLSQPDVICYLPAERIVPGATRDELITEWRAAFPGRTATDLKPWLKDSRGVRVGRSAIRKHCWEHRRIVSFRSWGFDFANSPSSLLIRND